METKQSSIEHLLNWMSKNQYFIGNDLLKEIEQAKEMHKQEIMDSYFSAIKSTAEGWNGEYAGNNFFSIEETFNSQFEQYYNETFVAQK